MQAVGPLEARFVRHYSANRRRVMSPANAVAEKARVVRQQTPQEFLAARCRDLGVPIEDVRGVKPKALAPIRQALVLEVKQEFPGITNQVLGRLFNRKPKTIAEAIEKMLERSLA